MCGKERGKRGRKIVYQGIFENSKRKWQKVSATDDRALLTATKLQEEQRSASHKTIIHSASHSLNHPINQTLISASNLPSYFVCPELGYLFHPKCKKYGSGMSRKKSKAPSSQLASGPRYGAGGAELSQWSSAPKHPSKTHPQPNAPHPMSHRSNLKTYISHHVAPLHHSRPLVPKKN